MTSRVFSFLGGDVGRWKVTSQTAIIGDALPSVQRVDVRADIATQANCNWVLRGITSNERYVERREGEQLVSKQQGLDRVDATLAALIPIRKNAAWWAMTQDERRSVFEQQSKHIEIGLKYLPPIARRLHHCRDLSEQEPFDFLTWFEFAPAFNNSFDNLLAELRDSPEWTFVEREVELRLER